VKHSPFRIYSLCLASLTIITAAIVPFPSVAKDKVRAEEIVAKHLDSIGGPEMLASVHSRIVNGAVVGILRAPGSAKFEGKAVLVSEGPNNTIAMGFENAGKFQERFGFDGHDVTVSYARPGVRGYWGDFLLTHENIIKEGLVGGVLSSSWPLLNFAERKAKLEYSGLKKINGRGAQEVKYTPRGSSDLEISLFFDQDTFQHVRTEYTRVISAGMAGGEHAVDASGGQRPTRYKMTEEFSDFRKESGLTLPHLYKVALDFDTQGGTLAVTWEITLTGFAFNRTIPAETFIVKNND
jgi:hypothetical protein